MAEVHMDPHEAAIKAIHSEPVHGGVLRDEAADGRPIIEVDLGRSGATDSVLEHLINLRSFRNLHLDYTEVTDKIMEVIRFHPEVVILNIADTAITDNGLESLKSAKCLEQLYLGQHITDKGIRHVSFLANLRILSIWTTQVTAHGVASVAKLTKLTHLFLHPRQISHDSIQYLQKLPDLWMISLGYGEESSFDPAGQLLSKALPNVLIDY